MSDDAVRPIIIKRKKVVSGDGHHGGAWKVAYADFVTAMMAFFMLMWLLNATTEKQRKGLADYFSPTIAIARVSGGGDGAFSGDSLQSQQSLAQNGTGGAQNKALSARGLTPLEDVQLAIESRAGDSLTKNRAKQHIATRLTDEGLVIEVFDLEGAPLFDPGTSTPMPVMREIAEVLREGFELTPNTISVAAHSQAFSPLLLENPSWSLTTGRAQATRGLLENAGLNAERIARLTGHGQRKPASPDPMSVRNNRLEITLLRSDLR